VCVERMVRMVGVNVVQTTSHSVSGANDGLRLGDGLSDVIKLKFVYFHKYNVHCSTQFLTG
jgi:hypothetical protein